MPRSSSALISEASVKRGGGVVRCPSASRSRAPSASPSAMLGRRASPFFFPSPAASSVAASGASSA